MSPGSSGTFFMSLPPKPLPRKHFNEPLEIFPSDYFFAPLLF